MRKSDQTQNKVGTARVLVTLAVSLAFMSPAHAERLNPSGLYSDAKIASQAQARPVAVAQKSKSMTDVVKAEVKQLVKSGMTAFRTFWGSEPAPKVQRKVASTSVPKPQVAPPSAAPARQLGTDLPAPVAASLESRDLIDAPGVTRSESGVVVYDIKAADAIPRLSIAQESKISSSRYALDGRMQELMDERVIHPSASPELMTEMQLKELTKVSTGKPGPELPFKMAVFSPKGKVSRVGVDKITRNLLPEPALQLAKFTPLTQDELRFLSGLHLYQNGNQCPAAVGLFHSLAQNPNYVAEANFYLSMCSRAMGLNTDFFERATKVVAARDEFYAPKILKEVGSDVPYEFVDSFGTALLKASESPKIMSQLDEKAKANLAYNLADFGVTTSRFTTALNWSKQVPSSHPKYIKARFLQASAEYQAGSKEQALKIQEELLAEPKTDKSKTEFQALVALNLARMYFQEQKFKNARETFLKVYKDHPLWLQSLTEMGWAQLMSEDFEGAIGNMYSIQSPFFARVYKPESFVIRTIGYLNLCQYGDAYKTLSLLEHEYRPQLDKIETYMSKGGKATNHYQTVRNYLQASKDVKEVDGLPAQVIHEMARHRDFTNLQKGLNRQVDEFALYAKFDGDVEKGLKRAQAAVNASRQRADGLRKNLSMIKTKPELAKHREGWTAALDREVADLNTYFFQVDLFNEAKAAMSGYRKEVIGGAEKRLANMRTEMERILSNRLLRMKVELARILDNNELLRYEVFAGSGENIRYQVAGGEKGNRVPADIMPKSKSLQWNFDGEYWEDEIGHYRSSLKNNCPSNRPQQASLDGGYR